MPISSTTRSTNINLVYSSVNISQINLSEINDKVSAKFQLRPIINQFPEFLSIIIAEKNLSAVVDPRRIVIVDQSVTDYQSRDLTPLAEMAIFMNAQVGGAKLVAYGFNFSLIFHLQSSKVNSGKQLVSRFLSNPRKIKKLLTATIIFASGHRIFFWANKRRYDLRIEPEFDSDLQPTDKFIANLNVHFPVTRLPEQDKLTAKIKEEYQFLAQRLNSVIEG
ncbi:hypothetical protein A2160_01810 [Candidatus Beckwithbacteria bacterium RBG_13_42_9]|uniref:Uncharacterized protein n=1 Tax=Candidatus Beckwithbacteria bacterium RBG_13_42_9 TaxID=1797457 RepID=A0A1F5E885_9BACT|nr:MAG: hypothetical protein A2160_01810 [Candidatus Beckwithbacteria bacterium RBG_13_42_9]